MLKHISRPFIVFVCFVLCLFALNAPAIAQSDSPASVQPTKIAEPLPGFDEPRRIILQLSSKDPQKMNDILYNAINLQKFYGMDNVKIRIIAFGPGMQALYTKSSPVLERIESLLKYEVDFVGCGNTMDATGHTGADLISGVTFVQAGIAEVVESQLRGWTYVHP